MGAYGRAASDVKQTWLRTTTVCPLCGEYRLMVCVNAREVHLRRIVRECDGGPVCNGLAQELPPTHEALNCGKCKTWFTRLIELPPAADAVDPVDRGSDV